MQSGFVERSAQPILAGVSEASTGPSCLHRSLARSRSDLASHVGDTADVPNVISQVENVTVGVTLVHCTFRHDFHRNERGSDHPVIVIEENRSEDVERPVGEIANSRKLPGWVATIETAPLDLIASAIAPSRIESGFRVWRPPPLKTRTEQVLGKIPGRVVGAPQDFSPTEFLLDLDVGNQEFADGHFTNEV